MTVACQDANFPFVSGGDDLLILRLAAGDDEALAQAYRLYGALVYSVALRTSRSKTIAEDVVQEVFCTLWRHPSSFDPGRASLRTFLGISAHRRAVDAVRSEVRRRGREEHSARLVPACDSWAESCDVTGEAVREAISHLPQDQRQTVELAYYEGRTRAEIAELLGIPEGTAKSRLRLAQTKLSRWLAALEVEPA